ncbi:hypothetical protein BH20ACT8_BH20ACT8_14920 [soil metagenome]
MPLAVPATIASWLDMAMHANIVSDRKVGSVQTEGLPQSLKAHSAQGKRNRIRWVRFTRERGADATLLGPSRE